MSDELVFKKKSLKQPQVQKAPGRESFDSNICVITFGFVCKVKYPQIKLRYNFGMQIRRRQISRDCDTGDQAVVIRAGLG